jgi:hypothetical protein
MKKLAFLLALLPVIAPAQSLAYHDLGMKVVTQVAIVCRDIDATSKRWAAVLGVNPPVKPVHPSRDPFHPDRSVLSGVVAECAVGGGKPDVIVEEGNLLDAFPDVSEEARMPGIALYFDCTVLLGIVTEGPASAAKPNLVVEETYLVDVPVSPSTTTVQLRCGS